MRDEVVGPIAPAAADPPMPAHRLVAAYGNQAPTPITVRILGHYHEEDQPGFTPVQTRSTMRQLPQAAPLAQLTCRAAYSASWPNATTRWKTAGSSTHWFSCLLKRRRFTATSKRMTSRPLPSAKRTIGSAVTLPTIVISFMVVLLCFLTFGNVERVSRYLVWQVTEGFLKLLDCFPSSLLCLVVLVDDLLLDPSPWRNLNSLLLRPLADIRKVRTSASSRRSAAPARGSA